MTRVYYEDRVSLVERIVEVRVEGSATYVARLPERRVTARRMYSSGWRIGVGVTSVPATGAAKGVGLADADLYTGSYSIGVEDVDEEVVRLAVERAAAIIASEGCTPIVRARYAVLERSILHGGGTASERKGYSMLEVEARCPQGVGVFSISEAGARAFDPSISRLAAVEALRTAKHSTVASRLNPLAAGRWTIILSREASASLAEAIAEMLSGDAPRVYLGDGLASSQLTIYDDPYSPIAPGARLFDDEAVRTRRKTLVEEGKAVDYLHTRETALRHGGRPGNAYGLLQPPKPHYSVLTVKPGDWRLEELEEETRRAVMVDSLRTWWVEDRIVTLVPARAWLVERGDVKPLKVSRVRIRVPNETSTIDAVTRSYWVVSRTYMESVVSVVAPTIRLIGYVD